MPGLCEYFYNESLNCRRIKDKDIPFVVDLVNKEYSYQDKYRNDTRTNIKHLTDLVSKTEFYIFTDNKEIVACVYLEIDEPEKVYFGMLTVAKRDQGKGLGKQIATSIEKYSKSLGKKELVLAYMHIEPWLKGYYEKQGFKENGAVWEWDGIKLINMSKKFEIT